jgi:prolipoprotein diacylglyceryltransferase
MAAFPSFHVIWAVLAAELCARRWPRLRWWFRLWAWLVAASCVTTGQHPLVDVLGGFATVWLVARIGSLYQALCGLTERIANSWREWRLGPLRVINHGVYAGAGGFLAVWLAASTAGEASHAALLLAVFATALGAALWAQLVEGSPLLLRPFGFYGGLLGGMAGALAAPLAGSSTWLVLAVCALGGPWAQALGRLRCLVQGCCHGRPAPAGLGIRYLHPRSRVCRLSAWAGVPLHPTPLYSLLWNGFTALVVTRLWTLDAPLHLVAGVYLMLNGLGRFVEEAWRGEPQTPVFLRLRLYQWAALASLLAGALMTALGDSPAAPALRLSTAGLAPAAVFGLAVTAAMGVDFPGSNRRYSRLV